MTERNPIRRHGTVEGSLYAALPLNLARDGKLSGNARSIALLLWSHNEGFETSARAIASDLNLSRTTADKGIDELAASRWLAIEKWVTFGPSGQTREKRREYHLMLGEEPFTVVEHERYGCVHVVDPAQKMGTVTKVPTASNEPVADPAQILGTDPAQNLRTVPAQNLGHKEVQLEVEEEVQGDDSTSNPCESDSDFCGSWDTPRDTDGVCLLCGRTMF